MVCKAADVVRVVNKYNEYKMKGNGHYGII